MILSVCPNPSVDKYIELPSVEAGKINRSKSEKYYPGGKGVHVALAVKELGVETVLAGMWGGPTGSWIKNRCSDYGIECAGPDITGWSRTCTTVISDSTFDQTEILECGPSASEESLNHFKSTVQELIKNADIICISGSWPAGTPPDIYDQLKDILAGNHKMWIDASGEGLKQAIQTAPFGVHVNLSEAQSLFGNKAQPADCALELLKYCTIAAVTNGADGLYLARAQQVYHAKCSVSDIISTVGAGDCLLAGLITAQYQQFGLKDMAIFGTACGTANCIREELGMLYKKDVMRLQNKVACKKL